MMSPLSPVLSTAVLWYLGVGRVGGAATTAAPGTVTSPPPAREPLPPPRREG